MADYDTADGCIISKARDDNEASSQAATQPCEDLSESMCNSFAEQDRSCEEDKVRYNSVMVIYTNSKSFYINDLNLIILIIL